MGLGADTVSGLTGVDTITYASRTATVIVKLDANANDGQVGELDKILTDVENVIGGSGKDTITGSKFVNVITGGLGADKLDRWQRQRHLLRQGRREGHPRWGHRDGQRPGGQE